ncbi:acetoin reductase family protein [Hysterangium stoloniferum]|nr:acetoin reductase family protein [Hysterangium stoloniferum]
MPSGCSKGAAIVTGSARGIGRAVALQLADDGYDIALNDLASNFSALEAVADEIRAKGRKAIAIVADVSQEQDVQTLVDRTVADLGDLYVMVANAGIATPNFNVVDTSLQTWERFISINLTGVFLCYRAAARQMLKQKRGGRIIGASSVNGKRGYPHCSAYCTTKFGVRGLTQSLASELAKDGITVNAYAPGFIDTPLWRQGATTTDEEKRGIEATAEMGRNSSLMGRLGTPENVAALVSYIVSDQADFMTGQSVSLNGGSFFD